MLSAEHDFCASDAHEASIQLFLFLGMWVAVVEQKCSCLEVWQERSDLSTEQPNPTSWCVGHTVKECDWAATCYTNCPHFLLPQCLTMRLMPILFIAKVGGVDPKQLAVYEEFARNVPGFLPTNDLTQPTGFLAQPMKVEVSELIGLRLL